MRLRRKSNGNLSFSSIAKEKTSTLVKKASGSWERPAFFVGFFTMRPRPRELTKRPKTRIIERNKKETDRLAAGEEENAV